MRDEPTNRDPLPPAPERPFWERPETVAWFAARPPDARLTAHGLDPLAETVEVHATTMDGHRTTLDGHFRKRMAAAPTEEIR